ncbi:MAG: NUDIX domain-containing protein [Alphaproteobacteria bacterium]|nr:NUDIX domain-containing protein [Alphaproteobacteria bacterium]
MRPTPQQPVTPEAASSLIVIRNQNGRPEILLGRRRASLRFMPGYFVFPGGKIDTKDRQVAEEILPLYQPLAENTGQQSLYDPLDEEATLAHQLAALRECLEETGGLPSLKTMLATPDSGSFAPDHPALKIWHGDLYSKSLDSPLEFPDLSMPCIAQAITPESSPVRFNARFYLSMDLFLENIAPPEGELQEVGFYCLQTALKQFPIADVTEFVMHEVLQILENGTLPDTPPLLTYDLKNESVVINR